MATLKRGLHGLHTLGSVTDRRRARTPAGALMELASLANEKERLQHEKERWQRRQIEIDARLIEIAEKEGRLSAFVKSSPTLSPAPTARPRPVPVRNGQSLRTTELSY